MIEEMKMQIKCAIEKHKEREGLVEKWLNDKTICSNCLFWDGESEEYGKIFCKSYCKAASIDKLIGGRNLQTEYLESGNVEILATHIVDEVCNFYKPL